MSLDLEKFIDGLHDYLGRALQPLVDRIAELERQVNSLPASDSEMEEELSE